MKYRLCSLLSMLTILGLTIQGIESIYAQEPLHVNGAPQEESSPDFTQGIAVGPDTVQDAAIKKRLTEVYKQIPALADIQISVEAGVVRLTGGIKSKDAHQKALELARRTEGVVSVTDQITLIRDVKNRLTVVQENLMGQARELISFLPLLIIAILVFLLFWLLASLIARCKSLYQTFTPNVFLQSLIRQTIKGAILFVGFIMMLEILDATALLGTIVGVAGILGLALGFALRDTVENYIASILLSIRQPFHPKDHIVLEDYEGLVMKLTSRATILVTLDGNHVRIPNSTVYKGIILNYSRNPIRRFTFEVGIDTAVDIESARQLALETLEHTPGVIANPPVRCLVEKLGDSNVVLLVVAWTTQDQFDYLKVKSEAIRNVKEAFDLANYEMPEPIYRLKVQGLPQFDGLTEKDPMPFKGETPRRQVFHSKLATDVSKDTHIAEQISKEKESGQDEEIDLFVSE